MIKILVKGTIFILIIVLIYIGCSEKCPVKSTTPILEGEWVEEYVIHYHSLITFPEHAGQTIERKLTSIVEFESKEFTIRNLTENNQELRKLSGIYSLSADTIFFYLIDNNQDTNTRTLHYDFLSNDSIYLSTIAYPANDSGMMIMESIGVAWEVPFDYNYITFDFKNHGTFTRKR